MTDAALLFFDFGGDIEITGGDLRKDDGLVTAVLISLFSDRRASLEQLPPGERDQRGWWPDTEGDRFGSHLWLLSREKITDETVEKAREYTRDALRWMIEEGVAGDVEVSAQRAGLSAIQIGVRIIRPDNDRFNHLWNNLGRTNVTIGRQSFEIEFV